MTSWHPLSRLFASARALANRCGHRAAMIMAGALLVLAAPACADPAAALAVTPSYASNALSRATDALTGRADAAQLTVQPACQPASGLRATCYAEVLTASSTGAPVHPRLATPASPFRSATRSAATRSATQSAATRSADAGVPEPQPGTPAYLQQAYDLSYLSQNRGASDTVAVVDAYDDPTAEADLAAYRSRFGLPACTTASGCFRKVAQDGSQNFPSQGASGWGLEISLDLDAVSALCPRCRIVLVEANSNNSLDLVAAQAEADALGANQISDSWGDPLSFLLSGPYTFPGVATVAATGDAGFLGLIISPYPAALPGVTAAGGTALIPASTSGIASARGFTEQAWSSAGSGCDLLVPKPSWQSDDGCSGRSYSDLSAEANPQTGLDVYDSGAGGWVLMGGTSESAPLIAAYYAIAGVSGTTPAWAYQHSSLLNDPVGESNGTCALPIAYLCSAVEGYDGPTGVGSISGAVTVGAPGIGGPGTGGSYTQGVDATSAQVQAGIYPNGSDTEYWWQYGTSTAYGESTRPADMGSGQAAVMVSSVLSGLAASASYHYRLVAQNADGTTYGYDFTFTTGRPAAPTVGALAATVTGPGTVKLRGTIDGRGGAGTYYFVYGTGSSYRHRTTGLPVPASTHAAVRTTVRGLSPHTTYRVRLVARTAGGFAQSAAKTFRTGGALRRGTARSAGRRG